jgi:hypothetical protein
VRLEGLGKLERKKERKKEKKEKKTSSDLEPATF